MLAGRMQLTRLHSWRSICAETYCISVSERRQTEGGRISANTLSGGGNLRFSNILDVLYFSHIAVDCWMCACVFMVHKRAISAAQVFEQNYKIQVKLASLSKNHVGRIHVISALLARKKSAAQVSRPKSQSLALQMARQRPPKPGPQKGHWNRESFLFLKYFKNKIFKNKTDYWWRKILVLRRTPTGT